MKKKFAVARVWYEANSFSPTRTGISAFRSREWTSGRPAHDFYRGTATELGGVIRFAQDNPEIEIEFLHCCAAPPGGLVEDGAAQEIEDLVLACLGREKWDAVYLSLHGAMACVSDPTPELRLIKKARDVLGTTPLGASFDLHAHLSADMIAPLDAVSGYHTYPHIDMDLAALRVLGQLRRLAEGGKRAAIAIAKIPFVLPSFNMMTASGPMADMQRLAETWRKTPGMLDVSVFGGFAYGDSPFAGPSITAVADDLGLARSAVNALAGDLSSRLGQFLPNLPDPETGLRRAVASHGKGPAVVLDPADNPLSGGIGDTPGLFRALLAMPRPARTLFAFFHDPVLVSRCHDLGSGSAISAKVGGRVSDLYGPPVSISARIVKLTDGKFRNEGPMERNLPVDVGRTAMLEVAGVMLIISESCQTPNDPGFFRLHGVDPESLDLLCVKAKNHFRAAFAPMARAMIDVDAPGPAGAHLDQYRYRHLPPGMRPLTAACIPT
jgi:microcystin degradation protein MlrC